MVRSESQIAELFETPHDNPPQQVFMITCYLDESEHSDAAKYTVIAGFHGKQEQWASFVPAWKQTLKPRESLHMSALRWNAKNAEQRIRPLLARLGRVPYDCGLTPIFGAVKESDYSDLVRGDSSLETFGGYLLSLAHVFTHLLESISPHERIKIVCEEQETYEPSAHLIFNVFRLTSQQPLFPRLVSLSFMPKGSALIEPADYLAFGIGKEFSEPGSKKDLWSRPIRDNWHGKGRAGMWLTRKGARETIRQIQANQRRLPVTQRLT